jgi:hypothetical protein
MFGEHRQPAGSPLSGDDERTCEPAGGWTSIVPLVPLWRLRFCYGPAGAAGPNLQTLFPGIALALGFADLRGYSALPLVRGAIRERRPK